MDERPGVPTIEEAFPTLFYRSTPVIERGASLFTAASLLRFHFVEAAMVLVEGRKPMHIGNKVAFVAGYPTLQAIQRMKPESAYSALFEPCEKHVVMVKPARPADDLGDLLRSFQESKFGFTAVVKGALFALVGLSEVLGLYTEGALGSDLKVRDVASKPIAVGPATTLKEAMGVMFERRIRRVFIRGENAFVSDREIVSYIFSPRKLQEIKRSPGKILADTVLDIGPVEAAEVDGQTPLKEAASQFVRSQGGALTCDEGVVSPWDMVMKPFATGHLNVR